MKNRFRILLTVLLSIICVFNSFATATPSNLEDDTGTIDYISPVARTIARMSTDEDTSITNTVDRTKVFAIIYYYDMSGNVKYQQERLTESGFFVLSRPSDMASLIQIEFRNSKGSLPTSGKYQVKYLFQSVAGGFTYKDFWFSTSKYIANATAPFNWLPVNNYYQFSGDFTSSFTVDLGSVEYMSFIFRSDDLVFPYGGYLSIQFDKLSSSATTDYESAGGSYTSDDAAVDTANNTATIATGVADVNDSLQEIILTISNQLQALWDQMYNYIHLEDMANADKNADKIVNSQTQSTDQIVDAMEENTNTTVTAIENHGNFIIEGLKGLFIPSDEFFKTYFDDLSAWFSDRLGFLFFPIELFLQIIDLFIGVSDVDFVLTLPPLQVSGYYLWEEMSFNFTEFANTHFGFLLDKLRMVTSVYLVFCFVQLCQRKWEEVMRN